MVNLFGKKIKVLNLVSLVSSIFLITYSICKNPAYLGVSAIVLVSSTYFTVNDIKFKEEKEAV